MHLAAAFALCDRYDKIGQRNVGAVDVMQQGYGAAREFFASGKMLYDSIVRDCV